MTSKRWEDLTPDEIKTLQENFVAWYHDEKRDLPWRRTRDPYAIWISEIMLQQTRVDTVIGYYQRFMAAFPTIADLANADDERLLKLWEGLGYYSRARNLKVAAQQIMNDFGGKFPETIEEISTLKGIGPYTAGAISSIAFGLVEPAIDGNVMRVTSRLFGIDADIAKASSRKIFDEATRAILSPTEPGEMNQAFMDLGSSFCSPTKPECAACPLQQFCYANATGRQLDFPVKTKKVKPKDVYYVSYAVENPAHEYLLVQRPETGLLANMWHFPLVEVTKAEYQQLMTEWEQGHEQLQLDLIAEDHAELPEIFDENIIWQKRHLGEIRHLFTHLRWHVLLFYGRTSTTFDFPNGQWAQAESFDTYVFPKPQQKLVAALEKNFKSQ